MAWNGTSDVTLCSKHIFQIQIVETNLMLRELYLGVSVAVLLTFVSPSFSADWPRYRGPSMNNVSPEAGELAPWDAPGPRELWRARVGVGFSALAVADGRLCTMGNFANIDTVYCLDIATGSVLWTNAYPASLAPILYEGGPSSTPTFHEGRVYTLGKYGDLFCFNATNGAVVWRKRLIQDFGLATAEWGFASSPLILGEKLILNAGGQGCALHKDTGDLIWLPTTNRAGYSTPVPCDMNGTPALIMFSYRDLIAVAQTNGALLWTTPWKSHYDMNASDPIPYNGRFFVSSYTHSSTMIAYNGTALTTNWQNAQHSVHLSPGVVKGRYLYAFHGENEFKCLDLETGVIKWTEPAMPLGSIIGVGDRLLILAGNGQMILADPNPDRFATLVRTYLLWGKCWTMPTFVAGNLYARNATGDLLAWAMPFTPAVDPTLAISHRDAQGRLVVSWPEAARDFQLERFDLSVAEPSWTVVPTPPSTLGSRNVVTNQATASGAFFRLKKP